jgi:exopolysaccharide biosynthesis WecB/TagA/CpsF family protein
VDQLSKGGVITWVNHYSVIQCIKFDVPIARFDAVGIDGFLLRLISGLGLGHSSADFSLPSWIENRNLNVGLVGGDKVTAAAHFADFSSAFPNASVLWSIAGDSTYLNQVKNVIKQEPVLPDLILIGMGAPLQEKAALEIFDYLKTVSHEATPLVATCGGWLDQLGVSNYYPSWATPLRLNWLVRLCREPRRLWKRYVIFSILAVIRRGSVMRYLSDVRRFIGN